MSNEDLAKLADFLNGDIVDLSSQEIPGYEKYLRRRLHIEKPKERY